ncbi:MAG: GntR family transcriptional regulator [Eubacteriales bacterium]|nr:GntR family transcriptional regulator [Eubacteriales bacterium]
MKNTLSAKAYDALKDKIITLPSGSYLSARQFAEEIGISYTPVREAFLRLQREGAIRQVPNVGFFVETLDYSDLIQTYQVRECIEAFVLNKTIHRFTEHHIEKMRDLIHKQYDALSAEKIFDYINLDIEFHGIMFQIYDNKHLLNLYRNVREQRMFCSSKIALSLNADAIHEHEMLVDHIESGNKKEAINVLNSHIENSKQRMRDGYINVAD